MLDSYPVEDIVTDPLLGLQYGTLFSRKTYHGRNHTEAATSIHGKVLQHDMCTWLEQNSTYFEDCLISGVKLGGGGGAMQEVQQ
ncbi:hypothetical protein [Hyphomonas sp.]|uniref:hypothetical protein n=1 Tax=Hyphomonas sp. TaxID=87 RepID=UPI003297F8B5